MGTDVPQRDRIDEDPEAQVMPILQVWGTRARNSSLPEDLKAILKLAREYNIQVMVANPSQVVRKEMPLWSHAKSAPVARKLHHMKITKCLRKNHGIRLVGDATALLGRVEENHTPTPGCTCETCRELQVGTACTQPHKCLTMVVTLLRHTHPVWNPSTQREPA